MGDLHLHYSHKCTSIRNDNHNGVDWTWGLIPKVVCHVTICDATVCDSVRARKIQVKHIIGELNLASLFTKEICDNLYFRTLWHLVVQARS